MAARRGISAPNLLRLKTQWNSFFCAALFSWGPAGWQDLASSFSRVADRQRISAPSGIIAWRFFPSVLSTVVFQRPAFLGESMSIKSVWNTAKKTQSTRLWKARCEVDGYTVRITRKWLGSLGPPHCPMHGEMRVIPNKKNPALC